MNQRPAFAFVLASYPSSLVPWQQAHLAKNNLEPFNGLYVLLVHTHNVYIVVTLERNVEMGQICCSKMLIKCLAINDICQQAKCYFVKGYN